MPVTNPQSMTRIDEIAEGIYRISTPIPPSVVPGGFSLNQFLVLDDEPLLFHTGPRRTFPLVRQAIQHVMDLSLLRWIALSHLEADECGALNELLAGAPRAEPVCGKLAAALSVEDLADRPPRALADGERLVLGTHTLRWLDAPHVPHGWDCGYLFEERTRTLLCGDLFAQPGEDGPPLTESDILGPSEALRRVLDGYALHPHTRHHLERLAATAPATLACMHGSAFSGDGAALLRELADRLDGVAGKPRHETSERGAAADAASRGERKP